MADFKFILAATPDAASNTSQTSVFTIPGDFSHFVVEVPALMLVTATGNIRVLSAQSPTGTFRAVVYSNNPATATSGNQFAGEMSTSSIASGAMIINEAIQFVKFGRFQFSNTCTANTAINVYGRKFD